MCNKACIDFGVDNLSASEITGKRVIEVGSVNVNGSLRDYVTSFNPSEYIGIDLVMGIGVDKICRAEDILGVFGEESFDVVISTELMEHVFNWRKVINNMKKMCKYGGVILITTRSFGFPKHGWPHDHWRFEPYDLKYIFSDFKEHGKIIVQPDPEKGAFLKVVKPIRSIDYRMLDIDDYKIYNIVYDLRI